MTIDSKYSKQCGRRQFGWPQAVLALKPLVAWKLSAKSLYSKRGRWREKYAQAESIEDLRRQSAGRTSWVYHFYLIVPGCNQKRLTELDADQPPKDNDLTVNDGLAYEGKSPLQWSRIKGSNCWSATIEM